MANKLQRDAQAKKEARKKAINKKKENFEKMDVVLEEILNEPDLDKKILELEDQVKAAEEDEKARSGKLNDAVANAGNKDEKGQAKFDKYKKGLEGDVNKARALKAELANKLKFYKAFKEHKEEILNLREYQLGLQKKLEALEAKKTVADKTQKDIESIDKETQKIEQELQELLGKRREIDAKLKKPGLSDEDRKKLEKQREEISGKLEKNNEKYNENYAKRKEITTPDKEEAKKVADDIKNTQIAISKTSTVWRSLLKGKSWDEISTILANGRFTGEKGTIRKIRDLGEASREKDSKEHGEGNQAHGEGGKEHGEGNQAHGEGEPKPPAEMSKFEDDHPRLGKIPFLAKFINSRREKKFEKMKAEYEAAKARTEARDEEKAKAAIEDKNISYIQKQITSKEVGRDADVLKIVAEKGIRETIKVDAETRYKLMKVAAENAQKSKTDAQRVEELKRNLGRDDDTQTDGPDL